MSERSPSSLTPPAPNETAEVRPIRRGRWARRVWFLSIGLLGFVVLAAAGVGGAEYYTGRPDFCGTCHVMDPYYESWSRDLHGAKVGARCVDCHYAPGEKFTLKAKFKGLSQVASYFSGRYGTGRPRAHVADASCLSSGCHSDQAYRDKMINIGQPRKEKRLVANREVEIERAPTVHFYHTKHLDVAERIADVDRELGVLRARLRSAVGEDRMQRIAAAAAAVASASERDHALRALADELRLPDEARADALALAELEHRHTRLDQLAGLSCSSCHHYDPSGTNHIAVDRQTCYTCHFTNEAFNRGTGECLKCHEPPTRVIFVHDRAPTTTSSAPVLMDHADITRRGVDCASCHLDVIRGDTRVTARDCSNCHDQAHYLKDFETRDTQTVREYHSVHVAGQRARCVDCHRAVQHGLLDPLRLDPTGSTLSPVLSDCQHCHPAHHSEQLSLLTGTGGVGLPHSTPNSMVGSRLNCRACHTQPVEDQKGDALIRATQQGCAACHGDDYVKLFDQWKSEIDTYLGESERRLERLTQLVADAERAGPAVPSDVKTRLGEAHHNIRLVRAGAGIHNRHYSLQLLDAAARSMDAAQAGLAPPQ